MLTSKTLILTAVAALATSAAAQEPAQPKATYFEAAKITAAIAIGLNTVLAPEYVADKDNGEHVKIEKKQRGAANFSVEITFNEPGFAIILEN